MKIISLVSIASIFFLSSTVWPSSSELEKKVKESFILIEEIWKLPDTEKQKRIIIIYKEAVPSIYFVPFADPYIPSQVMNPPPNLEQNELAEWYSNNLRLSQFMRYTRSRGLALLKENLLTTKLLIDKDLESEEIRDKERALTYISEFKLNEYVKKVIHIFLNVSELETKAAYTIRDLDYYYGIAHLIEKPPNPTKYFEILRNLQKGKRPYKGLIALLDSPNYEIRWRAAYSLAESGDSSLVPYVKRLVKDNHPEVRRQVASMGFLLQGDDYEKVYNDLVGLLDDSDRSVRRDVVCSFAWRKDSICARELLNLLRDSTMEETWHSNIWQAMHNLTGTYWGYYHGSDAWKPDTENNKKAIEKFEKWIVKREKK